MAQWTNIPTDRIEPGKPIRAIDGLALRDNPIAIAEGAAGAPRVQTNGIANSAATTSKIANSAVTTSKIANSNVTAQKLATGGNENNWVRSRIATSTAGQVGTYAWLQRYSGGPSYWGQTVPGSQLTPDGGSSTLAGTWRVMSAVSAMDGHALMLRIS